MNNMNEISSIATADKEEDEFDFPTSIITPTTATPLLAVIADCPIRTVRALEDALSLARTELATAQASLEGVKDVFRIRDELALLQCKVVINGDRINAAPSAHPTIDSVRQHAEAQELLDALSFFDEKALHNLKAVDAMTLHSKLMATIMPGAAPADLEAALAWTRAELVQCRQQLADEEVRRKIDLKAKQNEVRQQIECKQQLERQISDQRTSDHPPYEDVEEEEEDYTHSKYDRLYKN
jgi:hypothetical protein